MNESFDSGSAKAGSDVLKQSLEILARQGKNNRRKGANAEREIVAMLRDAGVAAEKISRSGYTGPDIRIGDEYLAECKVRKDGGWKMIQRWLEGVNVLFLREQGKRIPLVVMRFDLFLKLLGGRGEG